MNPEQEKLAIIENNISKTGYRALFALQKLMEAPRTRSELLNLFIQDPIIGPDVSKDTVTNTINTLKQAGCIISRPTQRTINKYILKYHPFNISFSSENVEALQSLRESIASLEDLKLMIYLNSFYSKISALAPDSEHQNILLYKHPLKNIDYKILNELVVYSRLKKSVKICYDSPVYGKEDLDLLPEFLTFQNEKLYVWGYCNKHNEFAYLRVDKISRVKQSKSGRDYEKPVVVTKYKLKGRSALMYLENSDEVIVSRNAEDVYPLVIKASVSNKFNFFQRILSYGTDCVILEPESMKEDFKEILSRIKAGYRNEY